MDSTRLFDDVSLLDLIQLNILMEMKCLSVFILIIGPMVVGFGQTIDFRGVDAFWELHDKLRVDQATEADWSKLFSTPYYQFYANWNQTKTIRRSLELAFSPKRIKERDSILAIGDWQSAVLKHLMELVTHKEELVAFQTRIDATKLEESVRALTAPHLPTGFMKGKPFPSISFGFYQPDANANKTAIAFDLEFAWRVDYPLLIAHEVHHFFTYQIRPNLKASETDSMKVVLHALYQMHLEGQADMIDKPDFISSGGRGFTPSLVRKYLDAFNNPYPSFQKIDSLLQRLAKSPEIAAAVGVQMNDLLPLAGHPHGYFAATTIERAFGKEALLGTLSNPFRFLLLFNDANKKVRGFYPFSRGTCDFLQKLEEKYWNQP